MKINELHNYLSSREFDINLNKYGYNAVLSELFFLKNKIQA